MVIMIHDSMGYSVRDMILPVVVLEFLQVVAVVGPLSTFDTDGR